MRPPFALQIPPPDDDDDIDVDEDEDDEEDEESDEDEDEEEEEWQVDFRTLKFLHWPSFSTDARLDRRVTGLIRSAS